MLSACVAEAIPARRPNQLPEARNVTTGVMATHVRMAAIVSLM